MKKIKATLCFLAVLMSAVLLAGCSFFDDVSNEDTNPPIIDGTTPPGDDDTTPPTDDTDPPTNDVVRYTVTEEEWDSWTTYTNYTIEEYTDSYRLVDKYTDYAAEFYNGAILIFDGDKEYQLKKEDDRYVIYESLSVYHTPYGLLAGGYIYDEFTYDPEACAYVLDLMEEMGARWEVKFENGVPVSIIYTQKTISPDGVEQTDVMTKLYTNVGTTVVNLPEYVVEEAPNIRKTATEEEWNIGISLRNFAGDFVSVVDYDAFEFYMCSFKYNGNAIELDGETIVFEDDKKYMLEEVDGTWYATEWNEYDFLPTLIPTDLDFNDYEYCESREIYVPKEGISSDIYYAVGFENGKLSFIIAQTSSDFESLESWATVLFNLNILEIGTVTIEVPEYVITTIESRNF